MVGPEVMLNGCSVSAKREVVFERRAHDGPGLASLRLHRTTSTTTRKGSTAPVRIGDAHLDRLGRDRVAGVTIGAHCVIGARSLVTRDVPPHTLAFGAPAQPRGAVGIGPGRSETRRK